MLCVENSDNKSKEVLKGKKRDAVSSYGYSQSGGLNGGGASGNEHGSGYSLAGLSYKSPTLQLGALSFGSTHAVDGGSEGYSAGGNGYSLGGLSGLGGKSVDGQGSYYAAGHNQGYQTSEQNSEKDVGSSFNVGGTAAYGSGGNVVSSVGHATHQGAPAAYLDLSSLNEALKSHGIAPLVSSNPSFNSQAGQQVLGKTQYASAAPVQISSGSHSTGSFGNLLGGNTHGADASSGSYGGLSAGSYGGLSGASYGGSHGGLSGGNFGGLFSGGHAGLFSPHNGVQSAALQLAPTAGHSVSSYASFPSLSGDHSSGALNGLSFGGNSGHGFVGATLGVGGHGQGLSIVPSFKSGPVTFTQQSSGMASNGYNLPSFSYGGPVSAALTAHQPLTSSHSSGGDITPGYASGIKGLGYYSTQANTFGSLSSKLSSSPYSSSKFSSIPSYLTSLSSNRHTNVPAYGGYHAISSGSSKFKPSAFLGASQEGGDHLSSYHGSASTPHNSYTGFDTHNYNTIEYSKHH